MRHEIGFTHIGGRVTDVSEKPGNNSPNGRRSKIWHFGTRISTMAFLLAHSGPSFSGDLQRWYVDRAEWTAPMPGEVKSTKTAACASWMGVMQNSLTLDDGRIFLVGATKDHAFSAVVNDGSGCSFLTTYSVCGAAIPGGCAVWVANQTRTLPGEFYHITNPVIDIYAPKPSLCVGNPIYPLAGVKRQSFDLGLRVGETPLTIDFDSSLAVANGASLELLPGQVGITGNLGKLWFSSYHKALVLDTTYWSDVQAIRGSGVTRSFRTQGSYFVSADRSGDLIVGSATTPPAWYRYSDVAKGVMETYAQNGALTSVQSIGGPKTVLSYGDSGTASNIAPGSGYLLNAIDQFGRGASFTYVTLPSGDVAVGSVSDMSGRKVSLGYAGDNLSYLIWPDGNTLQFAYDSGSSHQAWALTGVVDESGVRYSTYSYGATGVATGTAHANGAEAVWLTYGVEPGRIVREVWDGSTLTRYHEWIVPEGLVITEPNGQQSAVTALGVSGTPYIRSQSQPAGSGCNASTKNISYDANANKAWQEDFKGNRTCYSHDLTRNLEVGRIEGLAANSACEAVLPAASALPGNARRISTQWHPIWRLEAKVAEPRRLTTKVYNGQPDPTNGEATTYCAPSGAKLPDGSPIVVLCKQVEQATTDANGALGFSATLDAGVPTRTQQWNYNQYGQVLTAVDPLGNTTTNIYYSDTTADHTMGDLATVTNALSQVTARYTRYNPAGQWLEMVDANGITTTRTFDLRQRLKSLVTAGATTSYDYWPTGLLKKVTLPDASAVNYGYDDAHRLTSATDNLGNSITYTLDNSGNRTGEEIKDPSGRLAKTLTRVPDALNRIQQTTGRE